MALRADDINKIRRASNIAALRRRAAFVTTRLSSCLACGGYAHNPTKFQACVCFRGLGSAALLREAYANVDVVEGTVIAACRLLGSLLSHGGNTRVERARRLCCMRQAWGRARALLVQIPIPPVVPHCVPEHGIGRGVFWPRGLVLQ